jgi:hypothetical protein
MVQIFEETINSGFEGTIIDIESIGNFSNSFSKSDSRHYSKILPVIFGYITSEELKIIYVDKKEDIRYLIKRIIILLPTLKKPFYAFNSDFEKGVLFHACGMRTIFECELNYNKFEGKAKAVSLLRIDNYDDPFFNSGYKCMKAWEKGNTELAVKHNRSCLLKEKDILLKRGFRTPDEFILVSNS